MQQQIEYHFFKDCDSFFEKKIRGFHDDFVDDWLLLGIHDDFNADLESVEMITNQSFSLSFCQKVVGGIINNDPLILISHFNDKLKSNCVIYYLNDNIDFEGFYMWQKIRDWNGSAKTCHQVWALFEDDIFEINNHWLNE